MERETLPSSLHAFVRAAWPHVDRSPFVDNWHIQAICEHLEAITTGALRYLIINVPPRHSKSLITSVLWPAWEWTRAPALRYLTTSHRLDLAIRDNVRMRRLVDSPWYRTRWPVAWLGDTNTKTRFEHREGGARVAVSFGTSAMGEGGHRRIVDDPHDAVSVHSEVRRQSDIDWWRETWSTRQLDPRTDTEVLIMQRLHQSDLTGYILENVPGYEHLCLPAEYDPSRRCITSLGWADPRTKPGELLNPDRFGPHEIEQLRARLGPYGAAGQLDQLPAPPEGGMVKRSWWRWWVPAGMDAPPPTRHGQQLGPVVELPARLDRIVTSWDPTQDDTQAADNVAGHAWAEAEGMRYLLGRRHGRADILAALEMFRDLARTYPTATTHLIENKANGPAMAKLLRRDHPRVRLVDPRRDLGGDKAVRLNRCVPLIYAGSVALPHPSIAPWVWSVVDEFAEFPNGMHDDDVDAATQALIMLEQRDGPTTVRRPRGF